MYVPHIFVAETIKESIKIAIKLQILQTNLNTCTNEYHQNYSCSALHIGLSRPYSKSWIAFVKLNEEPKI